MTMVRVILYLLALLVAAPVCSAQIAFDQMELSVTPKPGEKEVSAIFRFTNMGPGSVRISSTKTSCSCTVATLDRDRYETGERGVILATFTIGDRTGDQVKLIQVVTDSPEVPPIELTMKIHLPGPSVDVTQAVWTVGQPLTSHMITITVPANDPMRLVGASSSSGSFDCRLDKTERPHVYTVTITPRDTSAQVLDTIVIETVPASKLIIAAMVMPLSSPSPAPSIPAKP